MKKGQFSPLFSAVHNMTTTFRFYGKKNISKVENVFVLLKILLRQDKFWFNYSIRELLLVSDLVVMDVCCYKSWSTWIRWYIRAADVIKYRCWSFFPQSEMSLKYFFYWNKYRVFRLVSVFGSGSLDTVE